MNFKVLNSLGVVSSLHCSLVHSNWFEQNFVLFYCMAFTENAHYKIKVKT